LPIPRPAPVTNAILFASLFMMLFRDDGTIACCVMVEFPDVGSQKRHIAESTM
jgi:hypothetical protein